MLTHQQARALRFIEDYQSRTGGVSPSLQEIADEMGWANRSRAHDVLVGLELRGAIRRLKGRRRAIQVVRDPRQEPAWRPHGDL